MRVSCVLCRVCSVASSGADGQPVPIGQCPSPRATAVLTLWPRAARTHTRVLPGVWRVGAGGVLGVSSHVLSFPWGDPRILGSGIF